MASSVPAPAYGESSRPVSTSLITAWQRWYAWLPLIGVTALALFLNAWGIAKSGYGNTYYAAATRSMSESWHNFFFGSLDPGGFITVDKPPVFLWVDALSARVFGYSSLSILIPSAIAGAAAVALLWLIMKRYFGVTAATISALVLALTPISVAVDRLNLPEPFLLLTLIAAVGCILRSLETKRWLGWTLAGALLVGVAFNTKMLVGWIPGPAIVLGIVFGMQGDWWKSWRELIPRLAVFGTVALLASASWMLVVDAWPSANRPYVGGSQNDTVYNLAVGYNGFGREDGTTGGGHFGPVNFGGRQQPPSNFNGRGNFGAPGGFNTPGGLGGPGGFNRPAGPVGGRLNANAAAGNFGAPQGGNTPPAANGRGAGGIIAGSPDLLRMFDDANGGQIAWFLPFAAIGAVLSLWRWRDDNLRRSSVVIWAGWALLFGGVFSYTQGIYHSYYTSALAPGVAAVVGMTCVALPDLIRRHKAWFIAGVALAAATLYVQLVISGRFVNFFQWVTPFTVVAVIVGVGLLAAATWYRRLPAIAAMAVIAAGLLLIPAAWSGYEAAHASSNTTLPQAGPRNGGAASRSFGSSAFDSGTAQLAAWLHANTDPNARWDLAVSSAQNASTLIADYDVSVMSIGGFSGSDPTITSARFGQYVSAGDIRYVLTSNGFGGIFGRLPNIVPGFRNFPGQRRFGALLPGGSGAATNVKGATAVMEVVQSVCKVVTDSSLPTQYQGSLYDCAGMGAALGQ